MVKYRKGFTKFMVSVTLFNYLAVNISVLHHQYTRLSNRRSKYALLNVYWKKMQLYIYMCIYMYVKTFLEKVY